MKSNRKKKIANNLHCEKCDSISVAAKMPEQKTQRITESTYSINKFEQYNAMNMTLANFSKV